MGVIMPRQFSMTWVPARKGWMKWHKGKMYSVSCRQLGTEDTKEASYQKANEWWQAKERELLAEEVVPQSVLPPLEPASEAIKGILARCNARDLRRLAEQGEEARRLLTILELDSMDGAQAGQLPDGSWTLPLACPEAAAEKLENGNGVSLRVVDSVLNHGNGELPESHRVDVLNQMGKRINPKEPVDPDRTVGGQVEAWVRNKRNRHVAGKITAGRYDAYKRNICVFRDWMGAETDLAEITAFRLRDYYGWLCEQITAGRFAAAYCRSLLNAAKNFITGLAELGMIPLPGNIRSREFTFDDHEDKKIIYFTPAEIKKLLGGCDGYSERTKLFLLLMLNCGMYQKDIADLLHEEMHWDAGTITRKRSKRKKGGFEVTYKLWPETFELLKRLRTPGEAGRVLLSGEGNPLVDYSVKEDGSLRRYDLVNEAYQNLCDRVGEEKPIKVFRKTSADRLEKHPVYGRFYDYFLAHAPKSVGERNYVAKPSQELFDEALEWLRRELIV
jgi:integrase